MTADNLPTIERQAKGDIRIERKWINHRQYSVVSVCEEPIILDALHRRGFLSDRLYRAGETLRGIRQAIGCDAVIFGYVEKSAGQRELAERQASFWALFNDCIRAVPLDLRAIVVTVCCDDFFRKHELWKFKDGLEYLDRHLARLYKEKDSRLLLYLDYLQKGA